jgi:hypothetical protein
MHFGAGLSLYSIFQESVMVREKNSSRKNFAKTPQRDVYPAPFSFMNIQSSTFMGVNVCWRLWRKY